MTGCAYRWIRLLTSWKDTTGKSVTPNLGASVHDTPDEELILRRKTAVHALRTAPPEVMDWGSYHNAARRAYANRHCSIGYLEDMIAPDDAHWLYSSNPRKVVAE